MNKKPEYKDRNMYDLSFPYWDHSDYHGKPVVTPFDDVLKVFKLNCKRFTFRLRGHYLLNDPQSKSGITYSARIHLKVKKTTGTLRNILKEGGVMSTVSITPTKRGNRAKDDGFYNVSQGAWPRLDDPDWVDDIKKKDDQRAKEAKEAKEVKRAEKKAKNNVQQDAAPSVHCEAPRTPPYDPAAWSWAPHFILEVDAQMPHEIDVMTVVEPNDKLSASRYATHLWLNCQYRSYMGKYDIKDLKDAVNKNGSVNDRGRPHVFDIADMRETLLSRKEEVLDDEAVWDIIVGVKKGEIEGWEQSDIKNRVLVFTDKKLPTKVYPGITIREWIMSRSGHYVIKPIMCIK